MLYTLFLLCCHKLMFATGTHRPLGVLKTKINTRTPLYYELRLLSISVILTRWFIAQHDYPINHINSNLLERQYMISMSSLLKKCLDIMLKGAIQ